MTKDEELEYLRQENAALREELRQVREQLKAVQDQQAKDSALLYEKSYRSIPFWKLFGSVGRSHRTSCVSPSKDRTEVLPLAVVDNSAFSPNRLTVLSTLFKPRGRFLTLKKLFNGYQNTLVLGRVKYADI